ncbi:energy transducer TonB [candidate division WOR-3 bacterium]|nr:energy transducer TonB [candidate division WOR-3 bacterium]
MKDLTKGVIGSFVIHGGLVAFFSFITVGLKSPLPEFVEILFPPPTSVPEEKTEEKKPEPITLPEVKHPPPEPEIFEPEELIKEIPEEVTPEKQVPSVGEEVNVDIYTITGELATRQVIYKILPEYPKGYNIETKVSVKLFVLPDGDLERMKLVKRGGEPFDEITLYALRKWKFEPLPENIPQIIQQGIITFIYKLR